MPAGIPVQTNVSVLTAWKRQIPSTIFREYRKGTCVNEIIKIHQQINQIGVDTSLSPK